MGLNAVGVEISPKRFKRSAGMDITQVVNTLPIARLRLLGVKWVLAAAAEAANSNTTDKRNLDGTSRAEASAAVTAAYEIEESAELSSTGEQFRVVERNISILALGTSDVTDQAES